jgi:HK97 family phage portal protein
VAAAIGGVFRPRAKQAAGGNGYILPLGGGVIPAEWPTNFWQSGYNPLPYGGSAVVYACRSAYSQTIAMLPPAHWRSDGKGGRARVTNSALSRVLVKPNSYQSPSDFFLYLTDCLYGEGNAYGLALRNSRFEVTEIHLMDPYRCWPHVGENGDLFYSLAGNQIVERLMSKDPARLSRVPARDVLHVRFPDRRNLLWGISPLQSALLEVEVSTAMVSQALAYARNQGRPSGVIQTDKGYHNQPDGIRQLRAQWNEQTQGPNVGGTPILTDGMKWVPTVVNSRDAQIAEMLKISDQRIATAYRVPLPLLSFDAGQAPQAATESLMANWVATGLGFAANHIETAFGRLFALAGQPDEYLELDLEALLRANFKDRIAALAQGVQGGIFSPNEARAREELTAVPFGDEPRVQQQVVPLSAWDKAPPATPAPNAPPAPPPASDGSTGNGADPAAKARAVAAFRAANVRHLAA